MGYHGVIDMNRRPAATTAMACTGINSEVCKSNQDRVHCQRAVTPGSYLSFRSCSFLYTSVHSQLLFAFILLFPLLSSGTCNLHQCRFLPLPSEQGYRLPHSISRITVSIQAFCHIVIDPFFDRIFACESMNPCLSSKPCCLCWALIHGLY